MKKMVAMIPARMGSKRIPKKNIRFMVDKPLIQYPIDLINNSEFVSEVYINSESEILGEFAEKNGIKFHRRPPELSTDTATNVDFTTEFLEKHECDYVIMVNPTSPLLRQDTLNSFCQYILDNDFDTVLSVADEKAESFYRNVPVNFSLEEKVNSQYLEPIRKVVWALTAWKKESFLKIKYEGKCPVYAGKIGLFTIPGDESCDLDTEEDWRIAEGILLGRKTVTEKKYWNNI